MKSLAILAFICVAAIQISSSTVLDNFVKVATPCEKYCDKTFSDVDLGTSCKKGCRLFVLIGLAKDTRGNKTENSCYTACKEAYGVGPTVKACHDGCKHESNSTMKPKDEAQTLHLLTPLMYVKSAYKTVMHHVKQMVTTSFTLYVEEDSGKMVVLKSSPKTVIDFSDYNSKNTAEDEAKESTQKWFTTRSDWMDCISQQSGLPRWILVSVLFGFIVALLWLCCVTTVTAPNQHLSSAGPKKFSTKNDIGYLCLYEPVDKYKVQPPAETEAPPLPVKVNLG